MRSGILCTLLFFVFVYLLRFPEDAFQASASGVTLWFFHVLPSLLPFMILSDFFIHTGLASVLLQKTKGIFRFLFGLSMYGSYAFLLGLFCGYPMGAKLTADLFAEGKITKSEAQYLLTICNNPGPMFVSSYLLVDTLHLSHTAGHTFLILYLSLFLTSLIFRLLLKPDCRDLTTAPVSPSSESLMLLSCMHLKPSQSWAVISSCFPSWLPWSYAAVPRYPFSPYFSPDLQK